MYEGASSQAPNCRLRLGDASILTSRSVKDSNALGNLTSQLMNHGAIVDRYHLFRPKYRF